jgi:hypothetical protein
MFNSGCIKLHGAAEVSCIDNNLGLMRGQLARQQNLPAPWN